MKEINQPNTTTSKKTRLTRQRKLVLQVLENANEHLEAEDIFLKAKARDPEISLATVYRALTALKKEGMIEEHKFDQGHGHFETTQPSPHFHFRCLQCGKIIEFNSPEIITQAQVICKEAGVQMTGVHLLISGYCRDCHTSFSEQINGE